MRTPFGTFSLNIRQKVLFGMVVALAAFGVLGGVSYNHLNRIDKALRRAEVVDDLMNDILEVRRYEKNYLLYAQEEDFRESILYTDKVAAIIRQLTAAGQTGQTGQTSQNGPANQIGQTGQGSMPDPDSSLAVPEMGSHAKAFEALSDRLRDFRRSFDTLVAVAPGSDEAKGQLRERGKDLVDTAQRIVTAQREGILRIVAALKRQLLASILTTLALGLAFAWLVGRKIINALHLIERATGRIARGDFCPLPVPDSRDETRTVIQAFNRMISELDKRQGQLIQEKKLASLGVLTSGIAHQLNNPLNNISTSCQILREEGLAEDPEFAGRMLANIHHEVRRSRDIVKGLLEFSRETEFTLKPVNMAALLEKSALLAASQVPAGITVERNAPPDLTVPLDGQRMQEVLLNLVINATQAMGAGPGTVTLSARADAAGGQAEIRVRDTGPGIAPEHLGRIFDPFFTLKDVGQGTGLGLSVAFGIVKKHGGSITAGNAEGGGAEFVIRLPLGTPPDGETQPGTCPGPSEAA